MDWIERVKIKEDKCVVKIRDDKDNLIDSVIIPTDYWYLPDKQISVFHKDNTRICEDEDILCAFNSVIYQIGKCHTNTNALVKALKQLNKDAKFYSGWLFTLQDRECPIWHSWCVIDDYVLDLSDNYYTMLVMNADKFQGKSIQEQRILNADFLEFALKNWSNSQRCYPVGKVYKDFLYVGTECDMDTARTIYDNLIERYPNHKMQSDTNDAGLNKTQEELKKRGIM